MKTRVLSVAVLTIVALLLMAGVAQAVSTTTLTIIKDAQDGHIDGTYTKAQVQAALNYVKSDPAIEQYSNVEGVLADYLASLSAPGAQDGGLMFTGGSTVAIFACGIALMGGGLLLRRRLVSSSS
jgi:hypothetical protein